MVIVTVMYPIRPENKFDLDYYMKSHMPLVRDRWTPCGMQDATVLKGLPGPGGAAPLYGMMAMLRFASAEALQEGLSKHGREVMGDVPNFTDAQPVLQVNEVLS